MRYLQVIYLSMFIYLFAIFRHDAHWFLLCKVILEHQHPFLNKYDKCLLK